MLYLPTLPCDWTLSRWTGRPHGLGIDPIGVECFVPVEERKRGLFGRRRGGVSASPYLHVLVHSELSGERIRSWARAQVARLGALAEQPDAEGDVLNRLAEAETSRLADVAWTPASFVVDGEPVGGAVYLAEPQRWAGYVEVGADRLALVGRDLAPSDAVLRTASSDEARQIRTAALRV